MTFDEILETFELLDDWEDRYKYVIDLGKTLAPMTDDERAEHNKVPGCASQVWLSTAIDRSGPEPRLIFKGDSDAHIVKGLVAVLVTLYSGKTARDIKAVEAEKLFETMKLREHLSSQRSNGLNSMLARIRRDAETVLSA